MGALLGLEPGDYREIIMKPSELSPLNNVDADAGFSHFDACLTEKEHETLAKIRVGGTATYDNFGDIDKIETDAARFFEKLGNNPAEAQEQASIVARMIKKTIAGFGAETAWVAIRASQPTSEYDVPRWHTDGYFYPPHSGDRLKAVITLKGASTLLNRLSKEKREDFQQLQRAPLDALESRKKLAALIDPSKTETTPPGCGTVFMSGSEYGAVHSEPPIHSERIFVSVLPGSKKQIEHLRQNWNRPSKTEIKLSDSRVQNNPSTLPAPKLLK